MYPAGSPFLGLRPEPNVCPALSALVVKYQNIYGISSLVIIHAYKILLQSPVSLSIQAISIDYTEMSGDSVATDSFLVLNVPTRKEQDFKHMKTPGAISWALYMIPSITLWPYTVRWTSLGPQTLTGHRRGHPNRIRCRAQLRTTNAIYDWSHHVCQHVNFLHRVSNQNCSSR